ncbi:MAG: proton-conducting membrane transporter [Lachnospiraceae bacterium]|nr:proton-conducting membrane transporter [Lachnospiraceae bacterium]
MIGAIFFPIFFGMGLLLKREFKNRNILIVSSGIALILSAILSLKVVLDTKVTDVLLFSFGEKMQIFFRIDEMGRLFALVIMFVWVLAGFYAFEYMKHEREEQRYFGFYIILFGILNALSFAGNLITFYLFYETMTLLSMPLILHSKTKESIMGALKYLFYSLVGAYMVLFGIFFLNKYATTFEFTVGGTLNTAIIAEDTHNITLLLIVAFSMILGFSVKAGMFPLHAWLPTAHPVAPAPASAVMSGIIVKMGVLGIIRVVYYIIGPEFIRGTWVQTVWLILTLITIFMGSMLAYREKVLKKRLAYSSVSQISYILFGMALLEPEALTGSLFHVVFHAIIKSSLFLCAGAIIYQTGKTRVDELKGIGKQMPMTMVAYTIISLALIGIPPASGFISKWHLTLGALQSELFVFSWLGPIVLLVSALLTAGYLLPISIDAFFSKQDKEIEEQEKVNAIKEPAKCMLIPIVILAVCSMLLGLFPNIPNISNLPNGLSGLADLISKIVQILL